MESSPQPDSTRILEYMDSGHHILITGKAGTGKSTLLRLFRDTTRHKIVVLAPTGIAALNIMGETIHSFFGFKPGVTLFQAIKLAKKLSEQDKNTIKRVEMIVIDEISMVRADLMDICDRFLRHVLETDVPFGGKTLIMIGDLYQLPPVLKREEYADFHALYKTPYFFSAQCIKELLVAKTLHCIELTHVYRQSDPDFINRLGSIRTKSCSHEDVAYFNSQVIPVPLSDTSIHLTTTNKRAHERNKAELDKLPGDTQTYYPDVTGNMPEEQFPVPYELELKVGARVMTVANDPMDRWQNGSIGTIVALDPEILVKFDNGKSYTVDQHTWQVKRTVFNQERNQLEQKTLGSYTHYPLKLAWAITIHKSQGQTFDEVHIDLERGAFMQGQTYVALSRCRTKEGMTLARPLRHADIKVDDRIQYFLRIVQHPSLS